MKIRESKLRGVIAECFTEVLQEDWFQNYLNEQESDEERYAKEIEDAIKKMPKQKGQVVTPVFNTNKVMKSTWDKISQ